MISIIAKKNALVLTIKSILYYQIILYEVFFM